MSIIVDALERVQSDRNSGDQNVNNGVFTESSAVTKNNKARQKENFYKKIIIVSLLFVFSINIFFIFKQPYQDEPDFPKEIYTFNPPLVTTVEEAENVARIDAPISSDELFLADEQEFFDQEVLTPFEHEDISLPETEFDNTTVVTTEIVNKAPLLTTHTPPPDWIKLGKLALQNGNMAQAIIIWNKGFSTLDNQTPVISIMINRVPDLAKDTLHKLYEKNIQAFSVLGNFRDKPAYYTLALYFKKDAQAKMKIIEQLIGEKPYKSTQHSFQKRIDQLINQTAQIKKTKKPQNTTLQKASIEDLNIQDARENKKLRVETQSASSTKIRNKKRLLLAQEAVITGEYKKAIQKLRPVLFNNKANWEVLFWIGSAKLGLGLYNEADDYFKNALILNAEIPQLWIQRAVIAQEKNNHIAALKFLHTAQTLAPDTPEVILNIAYSNDALGDRNGAVFSYREFLSLTMGNSHFTQQRQAVNFRLNELGF